MNNNALIIDEDTEKPIIIKNSHSNHSICLVFLSFSLLCVVLIFIGFI